MTATATKKAGGMSDPMPAMEPCPGSNLPPRDPAQADGDGTCATCGRLVRVRWGRTAQHKRPSTAKGAGERSAGNAAADSARPLLFYAALSQLRPSPANPRTRMDEESLRELADSIKQDGVLEPLVVRYATDAQGIGSYELIAGHRRLAAARLAGLDAVPVVVRRDVDDVAALRLALVENLQRRDLDPLDEAQGYRRLQELGWKQAQIAEAVHRKAPTIANGLRLLDLPDEVRQLIREGRLQASHGRALAAYKAWPKLVAQLAGLAVEHGWTSHFLEDGPRLFEDGRAQRLSALRVLTYQTPFDHEKVCRKCPFDAYRRAGYQHVCLNPPHYEELAKAAAEQRRQEEERRQAELRRVAEQQASREAAPVQAPGAVQPAGAGLPTVEALEARHGMANVHLFRAEESRPAGCSATGCPCAAVARTNRGQLVAVCTDRQRYQLLERRQTIAQNKVRRAAAGELAQRALEAVAEVTAVAPAWPADTPAGRALTLVLWRALTHPETRFNGEAKGVWKAAVARLGTAGAPLKGLRHEREYWEHADHAQLEHFARLPQAAQVRLTLDVITQDETLRAKEYAGVPLETCYFLGEHPPQTWLATAPSGGLVGAAAFGADGTAAGALDEAGLHEVLAAHAAFGEAHRAAHEDELVDVTAGDAAEHLTEVAG